MTTLNLICVRPAEGDCNWQPVRTSDEMWECTLMLANAGFYLQIIYIAATTSDDLRIRVLIANEDDMLDRLDPDFVTGEAIAQLEDMGWVTTTEPT